MKENSRVTNAILTEDGKLELEVTTKYIVDPMSLIANLETTQSKNTNNQMKNSISSKSDHDIKITADKICKSIWEETLKRPIVKYTRITPEDANGYIKNTYGK